MHEAHEKAPQILAAYLLAIKNIKTSDNEHTYRTPLETLLKALALKHKNITIIHEQSSADFKASDTQSSAEFKPLNIQSGANKKSLGRPDFSIFEGGLTLGYIENKRVGANLQELIDAANKDEKSQIARYLKLSDNLILTDYLNFWRVRKDERGKILQSYKKIQQIYQILNKIHYNFSNF